MAEEHSRLADNEVEELLERLEGLLGRLEAMPGAEGEVARAAVTALAAVYGEALGRMVRLTESACEPGVVRTWAGDQLVGHLLALHGVHPDPAQVRVQQVISEIQSQLPGGGAVEFAGIQDGVVQLDVSAGGCGTSGLVSSVREIVLGSVPDLADVEAKQGTSAFIPLEALHRQATR